MKRKLLDTALVILGAAGTTRILLGLNIHVPRDFQRSVNAMMLLSAGFAISLGLSLVLPCVKLRRPTSAQITVSLVALAVLVMALLGAMAIVHHNSQRDIFDSITWDDGKP